MKSVDAKARGSHQTPGGYSTLPPGRMMVHATLAMTGVGTSVAVGWRMEMATHRNRTKTAAGGGDASEGLRSGSEDFCSRHREAHLNPASKPRRLDSRWTASGTVQRSQAGHGNEPASGG